MLRAFSAGVSVSEPYHNALLRCVRQWHLQELIARTRIFVDKGATLFGVLDEMGVLESGEIFAQVTDWDRGEDAPRPVQGAVTLTKFPALHPGDVRTFKARVFFMEVHQSWLGRGHD